MPRAIVLSHGIASSTMLPISANEIDRMRPRPYVACWPIHAELKVPTRYTLKISPTTVWLRWYGGASK